MEARRRGILVPVLLDKAMWAQLPVASDGVGRIQAVDLNQWNGKADHPEFARLYAHLAESIAPTRPGISMPLLMPGDLITERHLNLVHSSWRVENQEAKFHDGLKYYQIHVILVGHTRVLDQVEKVIYYLDEAWPDPMKEGPSGRRISNSTSSLTGIR